MGYQISFPLVVANSLDEYHCTSATALAAGLTVGDTYKSINSATATHLTRDLRVSGLHYSTFWGDALAVNSTGTLMAVGVPMYEVPGSGLNYNIGCVYLYSGNDTSTSLGYQFRSYNRPEIDAWGAAFGDDLAMNGAGTLLASSVMLANSTKGIELFSLNGYNSIPTYLSTLVNYTHPTTGIAYSGFGVMQFSSDGAVFVLSNTATYPNQTSKRVLSIYNVVANVITHSFDIAEDDFPFAQVGYTNMANFGKYLAISPDGLTLAAQHTIFNSGADHPWVFVYSLLGTTVTLKHKVKFTNNITSIGLLENGEVLLTGDSQWSLPTQYKGIVRVHKFCNFDTFVEVSTVNTSTVEGFAGYGSVMAVAHDTDILVVKAYHEDSYGGAVYRDKLNINITTEVVV